MLNGEKKLQFKKQMILNCSHWFFLIIPIFFSYTHILFSRVNYKIVANFQQNEHFPNVYNFSILRFSFVKYDKLDEFYFS